MSVLASTFYVTGGTLRQDAPSYVAPALPSSRSDGDVILAGAPWQAWRAPSWEEIAAAEAKEKTESKQP